MQGRDLGIAADFDMCRAGVRGSTLVAAGKCDDVDLAAREHRDVGVKGICRGACAVLIAAEDGKGFRHRAAGEFAARDGHAFADGDLVVLCDGQHKVTGHVEIHVLEGCLTKEVKPLVVDFIDCVVCLTVVRAAVYAGQRDRAGVGRRPREVCVLGELAAEHDRAVLCEVERVVGFREAAYRAPRRQTVARAAVRQIHDGVAVVRFGVKRHG